MQWNYHSVIRKGIHYHNGSQSPWKRQWMRLKWPGKKGRKRKQSTIQKKKRQNSGVQHRHSTCAAHLIFATVAGWSAAHRAKVNGWSNFSSRKCLKEFTAECTEVYTLPGEAVKGDGICSSILPWRVLDVWERIWLQTEKAALPFRQSSFWPQWRWDLIHSPRSVLWDKARKVLPSAFVGVVKLWPFLSNRCSGSILKDKREDRI